jgi:cell division transport system permease protein
VNPPRELGSRQEPETPRNTLSYFVREAVRRLWTSKRTSFVAVAMIALSLLILGTALLVTENLGRAITQWQGKSRLTVFLQSDVTPEQIRAVDAWLASHPGFEGRHFVTKEESLARFRSYFRNLSNAVTQLDENPFPPSFEADIPPRIAQSPAFAGALTELRRLPGVDDLEFDWQWIARLRRLIEIVNLGGAVAGGVLALAAAFTIANVIRLTMLRYREEIEIMRLVGATERTIRAPFLIEGVLQGMLGGVIAVGLLFATFLAARQFLAPASSLLWGFLFVGFLPWGKVVALIAGGMLAGYFGSWLSVREPTEELA